MHSAPAAEDGRAWGAALHTADGAAARRIEQRWHWPMLLALLATIPSFYVELLQSEPGWAWSAPYTVAAGVVAAALLHVASRCVQPARHLRRNGLDLLLAAGLLAAGMLPPSHGHPALLVLRLAVAFLSLIRMLWILRPLVRRGSVPHLIVAAAAVLVACGAGYWWLEPTTPRLADGIWLAFVTATTVGYGDVVPTVTASRIFSVFVVLLGMGVLTLVTAAIAAHWVGSEERMIEREILRDLHAQVDLLRREIALLREQVAPGRPPAGAGGSAPAAGNGQQPVEDQ